MLSYTSRVRWVPAEVSRVTTVWQIIHVPDARFVFSMPRHLPRAFIGSWFHDHSLTSVEVNSVCAFRNGKESTN